MIQWIIILVLIIWVSILTMQVQSLRRSRDTNETITTNLMNWISRIENKGGYLIMVPKQTTPVKYKCGHTKEAAISEEVAEAHGKRFVCIDCRYKM